MQERVFHVQNVYLERLTADAVAVCGKTEQRQSYCLFGLGKTILKKNNINYGKTDLK